MQSFHNTTHFYFSIYNKFSQSCANLRALRECNFMNVVLARKWVTSSNTSDLNSFKGIWRKSDGHIFCREFPVLSSLQRFLVAFIIFEEHKKYCIFEFHFKIVLIFDALIFFQFCIMKTSSCQFSAGNTFYVFQKPRLLDVLAFYTYFVLWKNWVQIQFEVGHLEPGTIFKVQFH